MEGGGELLDFRDGEEQGDLRLVHARCDPDWAKAGDAGELPVDVVVLLVRPVAIEFGEGLKVEDGSRWGLMLQSQLHNRNNTLISGILIWKENIDKKLSGVEECSICFDIVNQNGQLPKKGCKTCKKKFHGNCIMKWFTKSNKSECPLCKSQFL